MRNDCTDMTPAEEIDNCPELSKQDAPNPCIGEALQNAPGRHRIEPLCEADYYGAARVISNMLGLEAPPATAARWTHGWVYYLDSNRIDVGDCRTTLSLWLGPPTWMHLTRTEAEAVALRELGVDCAIPVGLPFQYVPQQTTERIEEAVLVMPPHAHWQIAVEMDRKGFIEEVSSRYDQDNLLFCLTPSCYHDGKWAQLCEEAGIPWIAGAHPYDANSLYRMRYLFDRVGTVVSPSLGSHVVYSLASGVQLDLLDLEQPVTFQPDDAFNARFGKELSETLGKVRLNMEAEIRQRLRTESQETLEQWAIEQCGAPVRREPAEIARMLGWRCSAGQPHGKLDPETVAQLGWSPETFPTQRIVQLEKRNAAARKRNVAAEERIAALQRKVTKWKARTRELQQPLLKRLLRKLTKSGQSEENR